MCSPRFFTVDSQQDRILKFVGSTNLSSLVNVSTPSPPKEFLSLSQPLYPLLRKSTEASLRTWTVSYLLPFSTPGNFRPSHEHPVGLRGGPGGQKGYRGAYWDLLLGPFGFPRKVAGTHTSSPIFNRKQLDIFCVPTTQNLRPKFRIKSGH